MGTIEKWFNSQAGVYRPTNTKDAGGTVTKANALVTTVSGYLYPIRNRETNDVERIRDMQAFSFLCDESSDITPKDILKISSADYEVIGLARRTLGANSHLEVTLMLKV